MASVVDTSVKFAHSEMAGAPAINGVAGSLISVLDAFLVNGFGSKSVDSATITAGVCRLNFSSGVSCADTGSVILVEGAGNVALNGQQKVTAFSTSWVEFATDQADGSVTGTISFKAAPLGWEKVFSATNTAVYRPTDPSSTRFYLKVTDPGTTQARVQMFETMTDVNTGTNMMPTSAIVSGGYYWWKSRFANAVAQQWFLAGDGAGLYFGCKPHADAGASYPYVTQFAGDINSVRSGDAYCGYSLGRDFLLRTPAEPSEMYLAVTIPRPITPRRGWSCVRRQASALRKPSHETHRGAPTRSAEARAAGWVRP